MKHIYALLFILFFVNIATAQRALNKHWVQLKDKQGTPYSIHKPQDFLSPRAIERRQRQGIPIDEYDLPVNPSYIKALKEAGATVKVVSKWLNSVVLQGSPESIEKIKTLEFVDSVEAVSYHKDKRFKLRKYNKERDSMPDYPRIEHPYGYGANQIEMLEGHQLHNLGYRGEGMLVAVLDGGFTNVDIMPFFDSLRAEGKLWMGRDFVDNDNYVYESSSHGSQVLSTMASNLPGLLVGTAPDASYICIKTEDTRSETRIEEDNWVAGAEYADSIGVDVINSSLGYTTFNYKAMNYKYEDMDGQTSRATRGANVAATRGMIIVNSAGNSGGSAWKYIGAPADAYDVLSIGAVDRNKNRIYFSSYGPTADGRIKPNIVARGHQTVVGSLHSYQVDSANGTSFSSPVMAGMVTSLWQAFPNKTNYEVMQAIQKSGDQANFPDNALGYGVPDFYRAFQILAGVEVGDVPAFVYKDKDTEELLVMVQNPQKELKITIKNALGQVVYTGQKQRFSMNDFSQGSYQVIVDTGAERHRLVFNKAGMLILKPRV